MIITIDGPAGTGKSSVALMAADRLGFSFLDTGAMYRAVALEAIRRNANLEDARELAYIGKRCRISFDWNKHPPALRLNDEPVGHLLRGGEVTRAASHVAVVPAIREALVAEQQRIGHSAPNLVTEGRDQGTAVFPDAQFKFYLDATPAERAHRRVAQLRSRGEIVDPAQILRDIVSRDHRDATRSVGPLVIPPGAVVIDTTSITQDEVVRRIVERVTESVPR